MSSIPSYSITEDPNNFLKRGYRALNNTSKSSGSGLGLHIVKQICDYNDINIDIKVITNEFGKQEYIIDLEMQKEV